jgi:hypothetical protein
MRTTRNCPYSNHAAKVAARGVFTKYGDLQVFYEPSGSERVN